MLTPSDGKDTKLETIAPAGGGAGHTTKCLQRYMFLKRYKVNFNIWDTWGLTRTSYQDARLVEMLVDGKLPAGWKISDNVDDYSSEFEEMKAEMLKTQIHGIIFFIPQTFITDMDRDEQHRVKAVFQSLVKKSYNPMVVISRVDEVYEELRQHPFTAREKIDVWRSQVADIFAIPANNVTYTVNYHTESQRSFEIECLAYETVYKALENCQTFEDARIMQFGEMSAEGNVDEDGLMWP